MFHILGFIVFGFVVGLLARALKPGNDRMSLLATSLLGMGGALFAGWFGHAVGWYGPEDGAGYVASIVGAVIVLGLYYAVTKRSGTLTH